MQQAVDYLLKVRSQLSSLMAGYNHHCKMVGTVEDSYILRLRWIQQRGALMTGLTAMQKNFIIVIEDQQRRTSMEPTLFQLCDFYLAFLDFVLNGFEHGRRMLLTYPDVPKRDRERSYILGLKSIAATTTSDSLVEVSEKEKADLRMDITSVKLFRNTVKLLKKRLLTGSTRANRVPRLFPIAQAMISRHLASRDQLNSSTTESLENLQSTSTLSDVNNKMAQSFKIFWLRLSNGKLPTLPLIVTAGIIFAPIFVLILFSQRQDPNYQGS
ncbi:hypothetical protein Aperf_G00000068735 [Anoplocephala perfoliata]